MVCNISYKPNKKILLGVPLNACGEQAIDTFFTLSPHSDAGPPLTVTLAGRKDHYNPAESSRTRLPTAFMCSWLRLQAGGIAARPLGEVLRVAMKFSRYDLHLA